MPALYVLAGFFAVVLAGFLVEPLVRDEEEMTTLVLRSDGGSSTETADDSADADTTSNRTITDYEQTAETPPRCPHCGEDVERGYVFCGNCAGPLPTPA